MRIFSTLVFILAPPAIALAVFTFLGLSWSIPGVVIFVTLTWGLHKGLVKWRRGQSDDTSLPGDREAMEEPGRDAPGRLDPEPEEQPDHERSETVGWGPSRQRQREDELEADRADLKFFLRGSAAALFVVFMSAAALATAGVLGDDFAYWMVGIFVAGFASLVSLGILLVWVLPVHLYLWRKNITGLGWYIFASFPPSIVFLLAYQPWNAEVITPDHIRSAWACVLVGVCAAITFWYVSIRRRLEAESGAQDSE